MRCELTSQETRYGIMIASPGMQTGSKPNILESHAMMPDHVTLFSDKARAFQLFPVASLKDHVLELMDRDATEGPYQTHTQNAMQISKCVR
jgi:hypothetical protein